MVRTTVTIDDSLYAETRVRAARLGVSVSSLIEEALREALHRVDQNTAAAVVPLPTFDSRGVRPGVDLDDMSSVYEVLDEGRPLDDLR